MTDYRVLPAGDTALVVEFGERIDRELSDLVLALAQRLAEARIDGIVECVPTFRSLMVYYDPLLLPYAALAAQIAQAGAGSARDRDGRPALAAAGLLRRERRARSRRCRGAHQSHAGAGDRAAQRGRPITSTCSASCRASLTWATSRPSLRCRGGNRRG